MSRSRAWDDLGGRVPPATDEHQRLAQVIRLDRARAMRTRTAPEAAHTGPTDEGRRIIAAIRDRLRHEETDDAS